MRKSGVLLPVSSLPSPYGIGGFSKEAYAFVDFLEAAGQKLWQILPLGPTGYGDSPYQSFSTFAGNPYYIDLDRLVEAGFLTEKECHSGESGENEQYVDYEKLYASRFPLLKKAFLKAFAAGVPESLEYLDFVEKNTDWLDDYALYMAVKNAFGGVSWIEWDEDIRLRKPESMEKYRRKLAQEIAYYKYLQYLFALQWMELKHYANEKNIEIIGDIPIYVAFDSADTWAHPELFQLAGDRYPTAVAGCPPDDFSRTGQLWGNPLYNWEYHKETGYQWWLVRMTYCFVWYDIVRIDHFRGFDAYWSVPYGNPTAERGSWEKGPGYDLFKVMKAGLGNKKLIAEDLGFLTPSVLKLVKKTGYPGMKILQFAFDAREENDYLPHNYQPNCIVYTGTHDNDTTRGWFDSLSAKDQRFARKYLNIKKSTGIHWELIRAALASVADTAVIPMQDYLGLGPEARINTPSTLGGNWEWRLVKGALTEELAEKIKDMTKLYGRL